jgi:hypothetical protein
MMYPEPGNPHHLPHFHARYSGMNAVYQIFPVSLLKGQMPGPQSTLIETWAKTHQQELADNWARLQRGESALPITPLP